LYDVCSDLALLKFAAFKHFDELLECHITSVTLVDADEFANFKRILREVLFDNFKTLLTVIAHVVAILGLEFFAEELKL